MPDPVITSLQNQRVKDAAKLRDARRRAKQGRIIIDGNREILRALEGGVELVELFVCPSLFTSATSSDLIAAAEATEATIHHVSDEVFAKLTFGSRSEGVIAVARPPQRTLKDLPPTRGQLVAVLEGVEKPGNVGAVLRSADGAGIGAVVLVDPRTDLFNPNCIRASLGTVFTVPLCEADAQSTVAWLQENEVQVVAARVDAEKNYDEVDYRPGTALVLGSEAAGLSPAWHGAEVQSVCLPMLGIADSLNVSAAAAVMFYEARRQRDAASPK